MFNFNWNFKCKWKSLSDKFLTYRYVVNAVQNTKKICLIYLNTQNWLLLSYVVVNLMCDMPDKIVLYSHQYTYVYIYM